MRKKTIGGVTIASDGNSLSFSPAGASGVQLRFDREGVRELQHFLLGAMETGFDQRRAERVQVMSSSGLEVTVFSDGVGIPANARNISYTGALLELPGGPNAQMKIGAQLSVKFRFEGETLTLESRVQRRAGGGFGVMFTDCYVGGELHTPPELKRIIATLQERLSSRLQR